MGKQHECYVATSVLLLFIFMASQIHCMSVWSSHNSHDHIHAFRRINGPSLKTTISSVDQQSLKEKDLINSLPGQPPVGFKQYGGYVTVDESAGRALYYYFVEAVNANDSTPLVIWFNGGPGYSSLQGAFMEHGPFRIHSDGKTLYQNPYSWNNEANMLYLESPAQVGFSYTTKSRNGPTDTNGDNMAAEDNYLFLVNWLEKFPEYKGREFYITGQSYAGHYGPQLAQIILNRSRQTLINLRGVLLGNPGLDKTEEEKGEAEYLVSHALVSKEFLERKNQICDFTQERNRPNIYEECGVMMDKYLDLTKDLDLYSIYSPVCLNFTLTSKPKDDVTVMQYDPCSKKPLTAYLNLKNVQQAMHANTAKVPFEWKINNDEVTLYWSEKDKYLSILPILHELMGKGVRVWVYSGDADAVVSVTSTMYALKKMNLTIKKIWRPWYTGGEVGGYVEEYKDNFNYATVRGGGHAVPMNQPIRALTIFTNFIRNTSLPSL